MANNEQKVSLICSLLAFLLMNLGENQSFFTDGSDFLAKILGNLNNF